MRSNESNTDGPTTGKAHVGSVEFVRIKALGPLEVAVDGDPLALGGPQQRLVLAILVSSADAPVPTDRLIDALWHDEDPPNRARKTVQVYVANLRKALGGAQAPIESAAGGYVLRTGAATVDAVDFEAAVSASGAVSDPDALQAVEGLSAALALWNGPPYADLGDAAVLTPEITRLNELRLVALERRVEASLTLGHHREILSELDTLTTDHPYREQLTALQMLALYRSGRQAEALRAYQRTRLLLAEELGIDPSPQIRALEEAILTQDSSLDLPAASITSPPTSSAEFRADTRSIRGYELRERLDETDDATLWRAYQPATGREVTLRIFGPGVANEPSFVKRFEIETQLVAQLEHPHLVSIYDFWRDPDGAYVVMPLLRGGTLGDSLRRGRWKMSAALRLLDQIGSALAALHRHGLTHGGLDPDCVFLDTDSNAYLADAGITGRPAIPSRQPVESASVVSVPSGSDLGDLAALLALTVAPDNVPPDLVAVLDRAHDHDRIEDFLRSVRQVMGSDAVGVASEFVSEPLVVINPYKGLRAFQETDTADFFGREVLVTRLVETVADQPLTTVVGSSGSGKSSVVKAGLIPAVRAGALDGDWLVAEMFPGTFPFEELEAALLKVAVDRPDGLMADLIADDRGMLRVIKRVLPDDGTGLLLVIDQFEELFSLTPDEDTRRLFLDNLVTLGSDARSRVRTVVTLRADFFDRPLDYPEFGELVHRGLVTVAMPDQDSLAQMVSQPARQAGLDLEPGLVTEVVRDVMEQPGGLPLMQYALTELAERSDGRTLTSTGYRESGGVLGALGQRAEEIFQGLQPSAREVAERIFLRLVTVDENADDTRRRIRRTELTALGLDRTAVDAVLQEFGSFRLLSFDHDPTTRGPTVEVAHEALIREWPRLRSWVDDQREDLLLERRLREAVVEWDASDRDPGYLLRGGRLEQFESWAKTAAAQTTDDESRLIAESRGVADAEREVEHRRVRRLRRLVAVVGVALVAALVAGAVALRQQDQAESAAEEAELATLISRSAAQSNELSLLLALEAYRRGPGAESEQAVLNALQSNTSAIRASLGPLLGESSSCQHPPGQWPLHGAISSDGITETDIVDDQLVSRNLISGTVTNHGPSPTSCGFWSGDEDADRFFVQSQDGLTIWLGPYSGPWAKTEFDEPTYVLQQSFRPSNRLVSLIPVNDGEDIVVLLDDRTGEQVGPPMGGGTEDFVGSVDATPDGSLIAVGFGVRGGPEGDGRTFVINAETGEEIFHINSPLPAVELIFDEANGQLIAGMFDGTIWTIDIASREVVSQVATTTTSIFLDLGVRADGIVIAVSEDQVEFVDRLAGPTGTAAELRSARLAYIQSDSTVLVITVDESLEIIDLGSDSLIEQTWDVDPFAHTAFNAGLAGAMRAQERVPVVVDLTTGARTTYGLITPTGEQFPAIKVYPEADGIWAFSEANVMARWEGERMVEQIDLGGTHLSRTRYEDLIAVLSEQPDGARVVDLVSVERGATRVVFRVPAPRGTDSHPSLEGGLHVIDADGTLNTYDSTGALTGDIETGVATIGFITVDPASGRVAFIGDGPAPELVIVDPMTGAVDHLPDVGPVTNFGFGRDGELLALTGRNGRVRLWDVERKEYAGLVWNGSGASAGSPSWYDEATETMWVASSGKYLQIPLNPERWVERACEITSRDLTQDEWDRFVPGNEPLQSACP